MRAHPRAHVVVAGPRAADGSACCMWTSYFHTEYGSRNIIDAIRARAATAGVNVYQDTGPSPKLAIVAVGEASYTHGTNWVKEQPYLPADQRAIYIRLAHQGRDVVGLDAAAIEYPHPLGHFIAKLLAKTGSDKGMHLLSRFRRCGSPCADCPYRLVSNDDTRRL